MTKLSFSSKMEQFMVYFCLIYMLTMTGLYFHMDSRINVLQTIQEDSLSLFRNYANKDRNQQDNIDELDEKIESIRGDLRSLNSNIDLKLNNMSTLLLNFASGGNKHNNDSSEFGDKQ